MNCGSCKKALSENEAKYYSYHCTICATILCDEQNCRVKVFPSSTLCQSDECLKKYNALYERWPRKL